MADLPDSSSHEFFILGWPEYETYSTSPVLELSTARFLL